MNFSQEYNFINSKNIPSQKSNPYLLSNKENISNNSIPMYLSSESNIQKQKRETNPHNDVKKNLNLDISSYNNNSIDPKKKSETNFHRYSSFSYNTSLSNNTIGINDKNKKTLILDLDETLVHSAFTPFSRKSDLTLTINLDGEDRQLYVLKRPFVDEFLNELSFLYEIIIFTASISEYADPLLDLLDKKKCIKHRLFREHCTYDNGIYIKDLKIFDRKINNMIIIDNNPLSYDNNVSNGIPILSWYEDSNDNELLKLIPILKYMSNDDVYDVRNIINKIVDRNKNEIDYNAINKIINENGGDKYNKNKNNNNYLLTKNEYSRINKSEEPRPKIINNNDVKIERKKNNYTSTQNQIMPLKHNFGNKYQNENLSINILNSKYNIHNVYNYNFDQKSNINVDKKDPYGTRKSIFAPEEYNTSYKNKVSNFPFNRNTCTLNSIEERKVGNYGKTINPQSNKNIYLFNKYSKNTYSNKNQLERSLSSKKEEKKINQNNISDIDNKTTVKVIRTHSLVQLTKKALHLKDAKEDNKNNENVPVPKTIYRNKYFNEENCNIYNNYINGNKYLSSIKSDKTLFKNNNQKKYFRNYIHEYKDIENIDNYKISDFYSQIISLKQENSINQKYNNKAFNNNFINSEKDILIKRINNEKNKNFFGRNLLNERKNYENKYISNYSKINKDNYFNMIKKSLEQNKENLNPKIFNNSNVNYPKNKNNVKIYNNKRFDLLNDYKNKDIKNAIINHKSVSYLNNDSEENKLINLKQSNKNKNERFINNLIRSSSFVKSNISLNKIMNNFSIINDSNKENERNNINNKYVENLNYRYDINLIDI